MQETTDTNMEKEKTESKKHWRELKYDWCINNFASLMNNNVGQGLVGESFFINSTKWHFVLHPNGTNQESRHFLSLWLFNDNKEEFNIEYQVFVGEQLLKVVKANKIKPGQGNGILKLVSHIQILEKNFLNEKGQLTLTVKIYKETEKDYKTGKANDIAVSQTFSPQLKPQKVLKTLSENNEAPQPKPQQVFKELSQNVGKTPLALAQDPLSLTSTEVVKSKVFLAPRGPDPILTKSTLKDPSKTYSKQITTPMKPPLTSSKTPVRLIKVKKPDHIPAIPINVSKSTQNNLPSNDSGSKRIALSDSKSDIDLPKNPSSTVINIPLPKSDSVRNTPTKGQTTPKGSNSAQNKNSLYSVKYLDYKTQPSNLSQSDDDNPDDPPEPSDDTFDPIMQTAGEVSPDEPVAELLKIFKHLPSQDKILFIKLFVLQLDDEMLSLIRILSDSLQTESSFLTKIQKEKETIKYENNEEFSYETDNVKDEVKEIDEIDIEEFTLEPSQIEFRKVDVKIKKLPIKVRDSMVVEAQLQTKEATKMSNMDSMLEHLDTASETVDEIPWRFQSNSDLNDVHQFQESVNDENKEGSGVENVDTDISGQNYHPNASKVQNYRGLINIFECNHCTDKFVGKDDLERHLMKVERNKNYHVESQERNNPRTYQYSCSKCDELFDSSKEQQKHKHQKHNVLETPIVCDQCPKLIRTKSGWKEHMEKHIDQNSQEKNIQCEQCPKMFHLRSQYEKHIYAVHQEIICKKCKTKCRNTAALRIHNKRKHNSDALKQFRCDQCSKAFLREDTLISHKLKHIQKPHHCSKCEKTFLSSSEVVEHEACHGNERKYKCNDCDKSFKFKSSLWAHTNKLHSTDLPVECDVCSKSFPSTYFLKRHVKRYHLDESQRPFICDQCGCGFTTEQNLKKHVSNNCSTGAERGPNVECNICGMPLQFKNLQRHLLTHLPPSEREKSQSQSLYSCDQCNKSLKSLKSFKEHLKSHSLDTPYSCEMCDKSFVSKQRLNTHIKAHTRPYHCNQCTKSFSRTQNLEEHLRTHTKIRPYSCDQCSNKFYSLGAVKTHKKKFHSDILKASNILGENEDSDSWVNIVVSTGI